MRGQGRKSHKIIWSELKINRRIKIRTFLVSQYRKYSI